MNTSAFEIRFRELQQSFIARIEADRQQMNLLMEELARKYSVGKQQQLNLLIHRYTGNSRTFGFPALSDLAMTIEELLSRITDQALFAAELPELNTRMARLFAGFERALSAQASN